MRRASREDLSKGSLSAAHGDAIVVAKLVMLRPIVGIWVADPERLDQMTGGCETQRGDPDLATVDLRPGIAATGMRSALAPVRARF